MQMHAMANFKQILKYNALIVEDFQAMIRGENLGRRSLGIYDLFVFFNNFSIIYNFSIIHHQKIYINKKKSNILLLQCLSYLFRFIWFQSCINLLYYFLQLWWWYTNILLLLIFITHSFVLLFLFYIPHIPDISYKLSKSQSNINNPIIFQLQQIPNKILPKHHPILHKISTHLDKSTK